MLSRITLIAILFLSVLSFPSCKKEKSFRDKLIGTWHDASYNTVKFNSNNSGTIKVSGYQSADFLWNLQNNNREIFIMYDSTDTETWTILALDDSHFNFMQENNGPIDCTH